MNSPLLTFTIALACSLAITPMVRSVARRQGWVAAPRADRWHREEVATMGGVAIFLSCQIAAWASGAVRGTTALVLGLSAAMFVLGCWDDLKALKPMAKFVVQVAVAATLALVAPSVSITGIAAFDLPLLIVWVVAITNAINLLDNMDGLAAGVALIAATFAMALGLQSQAMLSVAACAALAGALAGFLVYNFNPASIFMGDSGSLFIGFLLASATLPAGREGDTSALISLMVPAVLLTLPLFDTVLVSVVRSLSGRRISTGGRDHTSHRLVAIGLSERAAVVSLYVITAVAGSLALLVQTTSSGTAVLLLGLFMVGITLFAVHIASVRMYAEGHFSALKGRPFTPLLATLTFRHRIFEVLLDVVLVWLSYAAAFALRFEGTEAEVFYGPFVRSLPLVLGCKIVGFWLSGVYGSVWKYLSVTDLVTYVRGVLLGSGLTVLVLVYAYRFEGFSRGVFIIDAVLILLLLVGSRLSLRLLIESAGRWRAAGSPVLIYGAGAGAATVLRELVSNPDHNLRPIGLVDDESRKRGQKILGYPVLGGIDDLEAILRRITVEQVIVSTAAVNKDRLVQLNAICAERHIPVRRMRFVVEEEDIGLTAPRP